MFQKSLRGAHDSREPARGAAEMHRFNLTREQARGYKIGLSTIRLNISKIRSLVVSRHTQRANPRCGRGPL